MSDTVLGKKTEPKRSAKCQAILRAAVKAFEKEGYDGASMDLISALAKVSKRTVYNYFASKEGLLHAVISDLVDDQDVMKQIVYTPQETLESQLLKFVEAELYLVSDSTRLSLARILTSIFVRNPGLCAQISKDRPTQTKSLSTWLIAARDDGRLEVENPELAATVFYGLIGGLFNFPALFYSLGSREELQPLIDEAIAMFLKAYQV